LNQATTTLTLTAGINCYLSDRNRPNLYGGRYRVSGITGMTEEGEVMTVERACRRYVEDRRRVKGDAAANDADKRFLWF
jgi:hypothetical protein